MNEEIIKVPDIGSGSAEVIEICVNPGDSIEAEDSLIVLESDKATMEVPAPKAGTVIDIILNVGDSVSEGDDLLKLSYEASALIEPKIEVETKSEATVSGTEKTEISTASASGSLGLEAITVPDIGAEDVPIIEICINEGDTVEQEDALIVLESDKATMEVPSPKTGVVKSIKVAEGDKVSQGSLILELEVASNTDDTAVTTLEKPSAPLSVAASSEPNQPAKKPEPLALANNPALDKVNQKVHAGPAVRKLAREFGVDLSQVKGTGPRNRILKEDVQSYVKVKISESSNVSGEVGAGIPQVPTIDFSQWGRIEEKPLTRLRTVAAQNFQRSWLNVPHVTQNDEADITELEAFRKANKSIAEKRGTKLTPLPFILKACAYVLKAMPQFCASLNSGGKSLIYKHYINIGIAVDTPDGLLVPVVKNVDQKGLWELSAECIELADKARTKKLKPAEMQGGCFTISSLGSIGGTSFTPIVNAPEVAILGLCKSAMKPVWNGKDFSPRLMLPLSLSYDHRAINGAEAARFTAMLGEILGDIRQMLL
ncbi:MAG: dihydrolipoyllysine-residue acetyltransferase [Endozoicomonas sp. (ex Botrylloides leachii)]|nr:dihydrolipoyllysine-residue acetyltransferase [Endozoicomonas sp. (ex Botrylloides leachii)]